MSTHILDRVEEWDTRPFTGGYRALQRLADRKLSGIVRADGLELFLTRGVGVAVRGGSIEKFENAEGTVYEAPSPALPVLAVMQEQSNEVRDRFYTEQTPIPTVDEKLSAGGFTGYIELSEKVLSGDYYLVYHRGESTSVAFVGQSGRLVRGDEAFEAAADEVGIYQVRPVGISPVEFPEPEPSEPAEKSSGTATEPAESTGKPAPTGDGSVPTETDAASTETEADVAETDAASAETDADLAETDAASAETDADPAETDAGSVEAGSVETEPEPTAPEREHAGNEPGQPSVGSTPEQGDEGSTPAQANTDDSGGGAQGVRTIPSIDPERTARSKADDTTSEPTADSSAATEQPSPDDTPGKSGTESDGPAPQPDGPDPGEESGDSEDTYTDSAAVEQFEQRLDDLEDECEALRERLEEVQAERDELRDQLAAIQKERDEH
jgi:hypothetical protein